MSETTLDESPGSRVSNGKVALTIIAGFLVTEIVMVASAFLWVFIYSTLINTGGDEAFYQAYAQSASPVVAVVMAFPVFFVMGRIYAGRLGERALWAAIVTVLINLAIDFPAVVLMAEDLTYNLIASLLSATMKLLGAYFGSRHQRPA